MTISTFDEICSGYWIGEASDTTVHIESTEEGYKIWGENGVTAEEAAPTFDHAVRIAEYLFAWTVSWDLG